MKTRHKNYRTTTDAGHGANDDTGAESGKEYECDYTLKIEASIDNWLNQFGVDNYRTRTGRVENSDTFSWRYKNANNHKSEVFVSIHLNGGTKDVTFYAIYQQGKSNESVNLAKSIVSSFSSIMTTSSELVQSVKERTRFEHLAVLNNFIGKAGILLEFGSIENKNNRDLINHSLDKIGYVTAMGIYKYLSGGELPVIQKI